MGIVRTMYTDPEEMARQRRYKLEETFVIESVRRWKQFEPDEEPEPEDSHLSAELTEANILGKYRDQIPTMMIRMMVKYRILIMAMILNLTMIQAMRDGTHRILDRRLLT